MRTLGLFPILEDQPEYIDYRSPVNALKDSPADSMHGVSSSPSLVLTRADRRAKVGVGLMELPPGSNTKPAHWHSQEEEHLYALWGKAALFLGTEEFSLVPGSYVCFPASQSEPHYLANTGTEPFIYLMIGERIEDDEVTYSPGAAFPP